MAIKTSLMNMQIGDKISCEYISKTSGAVGSFTNLGSATKSLLSTTPGATPDGSFYFIHSGYDYFGRMKLIADRNIQGSITWDTINAASIASGCGADITNTYKWTIGDGGTALCYSTTRSSVYTSSCIMGDNLYAAWCEYANVSPYGQQIRIKKWDGNSWTFIDGGSTYGINYNTSVSTHYPSIIGFGTDLFAAWVESNSLRIKKWNGTSWSTADNNTGIQFDTKGITGLMLGVHNNELYIAWSEYTGTNYLVRVKKWNGTGWDVIDNGGLNYDVNNSAEFLTMTSYNGKLYILFKQSDVLNGKIKYKVWNGTSWELDGNENGLNYNYPNHFPSVGSFSSVTYNGFLYVSWPEQNISGGYSVRVKKFNGIIWESADNNGSINYDNSSVANYTRLNVHNNELYVTWTEKNQIRMKKFNGKQWISVDGYSSLNISSSNNATLPVISSYKGMLALIWNEYNGSQTIIRMKYGIGIQSFPSTNLYIRLLTGGISSSDKDNEWDSIIVSSTLGGTITAGDNNVWNWSGAYSWTSTTTTSAGNTYRTLRGHDNASSFNFNVTSTSNSTYAFRPVLIVENLNTAPTLTLSVDTDTTHFTPVNITGTITDEEDNEVQYRILLNNIVIEDWSVLAQSPVDIDYTITGDLFLTGSNTIKLEAKDSVGAKKTWTQIVNFTNGDITTTTSIDKASTFNSPVIISGQITDNENDTVQYRISINGEVKFDWTTPTISPLDVNVTIPLNYLTVGSNTILFEYKDAYGANGDWIGYVMLKGIDSFYSDEFQCYNYSSSLKASYTNITYLKTTTINDTLGYVKSAIIALNIINGDGNSGIIKIAPITTDWSSSTVSMQNLPNIDINNTVSFNITNNSGLSSINAIDLAKKIYNLHTTTYGIAIFSTGITIELDLFDNDMNTLYQPTELIQPSVVFGNKVSIEWKPLILENPGEFLKLVVKRSNTENFDSATTITEIIDTSTLYYIDETITLGNYYYKIEVYYIDIPTPLLTDNITIPVPDKGFRNILIDGVYDLKLAEGVAFDDIATDYNFYSTPDRIKLRSLDVGTLVGGIQSQVFAFEVVSGYEDKDFTVTLRTSKNGIMADEYIGYCLLPDAARDDNKTKVEMSLSDSESFTPVYPLTFDLNRGQKKTVYIRIYSSIITSGNDLFQINLSGRQI